MANIKLLKNGDTEVIPRTTTQAVCMDDGTSFDVAVQSFTEANNELASTKNALESVVGSVSEDIAAQLNQLNETKALLKTRLTEKGLDVASEDNFYNLANKVGEIKSGGKIKYTRLTSYNDSGTAVFENFLSETDTPYKIPGNKSFSIVSIASIGEGFPFRGKLGVTYYIGGESGRDLYIELDLNGIRPNAYVNSIDKIEIE